MFRKGRPAPTPPALSPRADAFLAELLGEHRGAAGVALGAEAAGQKKGVDYFETLTQQPTPEFRLLPERFENLIAFIKLLRNKRMGAILGSDKSLCDHLGLQENQLLGILLAITQGCGSTLAQNMQELFQLLYGIIQDAQGQPKNIDTIEVIYKLLGGTSEDLPKVVDAKVRQFLQITNGMQWMPHASALNLSDALVAVEEEMRKPAGQPRRTIQDISAAHGVNLQTPNIPWGTPVAAPVPAGIPVAAAPVPAPAVQVPAPAPATPVAVQTPRAVGPAVAAATAPAPVAPGGIDRADVLRDPALKAAGNFLSRLISHFIQTDATVLGDLDIKINDALSNYFNYEYPLGTALFVAKGRAAKTGGAPALFEILEATFKPGNTAGLKQVILHVHIALKDLPELAAIAKPVTPRPAPQAAIPVAAPAAVPPPLPAEVMAAPTTTDPRIEKEQALKTAVNWFNQTLIPALNTLLDPRLTRVINEIDRRFIAYMATYQQTRFKIGSLIYGEVLSGETDIQRIIPKVVRTRDTEALIIVLYKLISNLNLK